MKHTLDTSLFSKLSTLAVLIVLPFGLFGCQKHDSATQTSQPSSSPASSVISPNTTATASQPKSISSVKADDALTQLVANTLNNGYLLAINQHPKLTADQKKCLVNFDYHQTVKLSQDLLQKNLTQSELKEANDFYALPVGQKIVQFNQKLLDNLKNGITKAGNLDVTDDEKLQISAFIKTATGQKIQQLATTQLQSTFAPIETAQLNKCQVTAEQFYATMASTPAMASNAKPK